MDKPLLSVANLSVNYGTVPALNDIDFHVDSGEIIAMIGPNGAGKSTALKAVCGMLPEFSGQIVAGKILFNGKDITDWPTHELVKIGISLVPEGRRVFPTMTVKENLEMGAFLVSWINVLLMNSRTDSVLTMFPVLKDRLNQKAGTLSGGEQQQLALGRALMLEPKLLILDEPSLGLSPNYIGLVFEKLKQINENGTSILLVEQNARMALETCDRAYVYDIGSIGLNGTKAEMLNNSRVRDIYLGSTI